MTDKHCRHMCVCGCTCHMHHANMTCGMAGPSSGSPFVIMQEGHTNDDNTTHRRFYCAVSHMQARIIAYGVRRHQR